MQTAWLVGTALALTISSTRLFAAALPPTRLSRTFASAAATNGAAAPPPLPAPATASARAAPIPWETVETGAARAELLADDGVTKIFLFRFHLAHFRPRVVVGSGRRPLPSTAADLLQRSGAVAAVNGGFFDEQLRPLGLRIADGTTRVPLRAKVDWGVLAIRETHARIVHSREAADDPSVLAGAGGEQVTGALQVGPRLLVNGLPLRLKPQVARRTAVALDRGGRSLTLVVTDAPIEANALARRLSACGFDSAVMLDGGPSTQLAVQLGPIKVDLPGGYPVPDLLAIQRTGRPPGRAPAPARP